MRRRVKREVVSFKAEPELLTAMKGVRNRSAFIRAAVLVALDGSCPLCGGSGILSPKQKHHWDEFIRDHSLEECAECHELKLVCASMGRRRKRSSGTRAKRRENRQ